MTLTRRSLLLGAAATGICTPLAGFAAGPRAIGGHAFGSYWRMVAPDVDVAVVTQAIDAVITRTNDAMSPYLAASELTLFNQTESVDWVPLSADLAIVMHEALATAEASNGVFDPTVGPIVGRYGFGPMRGTRIGGVGDLELRRRALRKAKPGLSIDLCGIAKGWALDRIAEVLDTLGAQSYLVELGGEAYVRGRSRWDRDWRVAVDGTNVALGLRDQAVATSGILSQGYRIGAQRYGHIIDPRIEAPATGDLLSVSVIAPTGIQADAWATALFAQGTDAAIVTAEAQELAAVLILKDGSGTKAVATDRARPNLVNWRDHG